MTTQLIPVKTRRMVAPKDDLYEVLAESLPPLEEGDVLVITSKVVSIHLGLCTPSEEVGHKEELVEQESEWFIPQASHAHGVSLAVLHNALLSTAGVDETNGNGYTLTLPPEPSKTAREIWHWLKEKYDIKKLGVVINDSHCIPLRRGVVGISIGFFGFKPLTDYRGKQDLFGKYFKLSTSNQLDSIAAAAGGMMGEGSESTPAVIVRDWSRLEFLDEKDQQDFYIPLEEDLFAPLLNVFKTLGRKGKR